MLREKILLLFIASLIFFGANAQNVHGNVDLEDSHKAGSSKGDGGSNIVNVDQYTGTASVSIPLYDFSVDNLGLGISLGYTAKGIRVDEVAGPVGLGWGLNAGGTITREVAGIEDEVTLPTAFLTFTSDSLQGILVPGAQPYSQDTLVNHYDEQEYDIFHFNAGGLSFSFSINSAGQILTSPKSDVKIEIITKDSSGSGFTNIRSGIQHKTGIDEDHDIMTFKVTDEFGNIFYFDRGDYQKKKFKFDHGQFTNDSGEYFSTNTWILTKILTYSGKQIKYYYDHTHVKYLQDVSQVLTNKPPVADIVNGVPVLLYDPLEVKEQKFDGEVYQLNRIEYPNNTVATFDLGKDSNARCDCQANFVVKSVKIEREQGVENYKLPTTYRFNYAYFNANKYGQTIYPELVYPTPCSTIAHSLTIPSNEDTAVAQANHLSKGLRLKLKSIQRIGTDDTSKDPFYSFEYNSTRLPYRFSPSKDYYGYFNNEVDSPYVRDNQIDVFFGANDYPNDTLHLSIPFHTDPETGKNWGVKRRDNFTYAQAAVLTKIKNDIGGTTELIYQDYNLTNPDSSYGRITGIGITIDPALEGDTVNDGLCIWKIVASDDFNSEHTTTTEYTLSDGQRFHRGGYCWYPDGNGDKVYTSFFVGPNTYINGSNHGFSEVTMVTKGLSGAQISKAISKFSNLMYLDANNHLVSCIQKPTCLGCHTMPARMMRYRMGLPKVLERYDENNFMTSKSENSYSYFTYGPQIENNKAFSAAGGYAWTYDILDHEALRLTKTVSSRYSYDPVSSSTKTFSTTYDYVLDDNSNVISTTWTDSKNDTFKKYKYYAYNYLNKYGYVEALDSMDRKHMHHELSNEIWKMQGSDSVLLNFSITVPKYNTANLTLQFPAAFISTSKSPIASSDVFPASGPYRSIDRLKALKFESFSAYGTNLLKSSQVMKYDISGNETEEKVNNEDIYNSSIYDTYSGEQLASVSNAHYEDIAYSSFEGLYSNKGIADDNKGNWDFDPTDIQAKINAACSTSMTGYYVLDIYGSSKEVVSKALKKKKYILSFWLSSYTDPSVTVDTAGHSSSVACTLQNAVGNWKLYTAVVQPDSGWNITIHGIPTPFISQPNSYAYLDDLRLHPADAMMTSSTYEPMFGVGSMTDINNYITYYEYNVFGRRIISRDMRGYIIKKIEASYNNLDGDDPNTGSEGSGGGGQ